MERLALRAAAPRRAARIATTDILTTVAKLPGNGTSQLTNLVRKSVTFTPDLRPVTTSNPVNWSAVVRDNVQFSVGASSPYALSYQWLKNGSKLGGQTTATATLNSVALLDDGTAYQCIVSNHYGAVTNSIATLTGTAVAYLSMQNAET